MMEDEEETGPVITYKSVQTECAGLVYTFGNVDNLKGDVDSGSDRCASFSMLNIHLAPTKVKILGS